MYLPETALPLSPTQTLASNATATDFQDVGAFMRNGGQRGPQRMILREGTYAFNLAQFIVITAEKVYSLAVNRDEEVVMQQMASLISDRNGFTPVVIKDADDSMGIVTVHDGPSLPEGEIIAPPVGDDPAVPDTYHNKFQDPRSFPGRRRHARASATGVGRRHLLHQPAFCYGGDDPQDGDRSGQCRCRDLLYGRMSAPICRESIISMANW